ncbi:MAG TPA: hypothetical protein DD412_08800 [Holosporales bacterium]|nr:hypothetical protein [Holosporales bacterium]
MRHNAHHQTALEILDTYRPTKSPLASHIKKELKNRRYAGSKDRRTITEIIYTVMRRAPLLLEALGLPKWEINKGRPLMLAYLALYQDTATLNEIFCGDGHSPSACTDEELDFISTLSLENNFSEAAQNWMGEWLFATLQEICNPEDFDQFKEQAPFDIRVSQSLCDIKDALEQDKTITLKETDYSPLGLRVSSQHNLQNHPLFQEGAFDIQEESSQIVSLLCDPKPSMKILDLCAGAGGKSLALAALCPEAEITATDIAPHRLDIAQKRAHQQNLTNIHFVDYRTFIRDVSHIDLYDLVLADASCSGTGTLRRHPELKVSLSPDIIEDYIQTQQQLLIDAQRFVGPKGRLVYATCSLLKRENQDQAKWFLENHPFFSEVKAKDICDKLLKKIPEQTDSFLELTPGKHKTDGFFAAFFDKD